MIQRKKQWTNEEIEMLESIKKTFKQKKWKLISKNLAKKGFKRSQHECRHKWVNCLNPLINHGPWTDQELITLYTEYEKNHSQWSIIQKALPNRTQIRIKNHFYGVLRNIMRFILKYFKSIPGKQSEVSNKINPNSLQYIYRGEGQYSYLKDEIKNAIFSMEFYFDKQKLFKIMEKNKSIYQQLNRKLLEEVNNINNQDAQRQSNTKQKSKGKMNNATKLENSQKITIKSQQRDANSQQIIQQSHPTYRNNFTNTADVVQPAYNLPMYYNPSVQSPPGVYIFFPQKAVSFTFASQFQNNYSFQNSYIKFQHQQ